MPPAAPLDVVVVMDPINPSRSPGFKFRDAARSPTARPSPALPCAPADCRCDGRTRRAGSDAARHRRPGPLVRSGIGIIARVRAGPGRADAQGSPVDADYLHDTQILASPGRARWWSTTRRGLRDFNEKLAALLFPQCCPPTRSAATPPRSGLRQRTCSEAVLKPLDGMGGRSIFRAAPARPTLNVILETLTEGGRPPSDGPALPAADRGRRQAHPAGRRRTGRLLPGRGSRRR